MRTNIQIFSILLILFGILLFGELIGIFRLDMNLILSYALMVYGLASVFLLFGGRHKGLLFTSTVIFLLGLNFYLRIEYELLNLTNLFLPFALFFVGGGFFILFLDSPKEFSFLIVSLMLMIFGYFSFQLIDSIFIFRYANQLGLLLIDALPLLLILSGIILLLNQKDMKSI